MKVWRKKWPFLKTRWIFYGKLEVTISCCSILNSWHESRNVRSWTCGRAYLLSKSLFWFLRHLSWCQIRDFRHTIRKKSQISKKSNFCQKFRLYTFFLLFTITYHVILEFYYQKLGWNLKMNKFWINPDVYFQLLNEMIKLYLIRFRYVLRTLVKTRPDYECLLTYAQMLTFHMSALQYPFSKVTKA